MRIAVLGAAGQLGRDLCSRLSGNVIPLSRLEIDLTRPGDIPSCVAALNVDAFINCAAYNFVDVAESEPEAAFAVNAWGVRTLASACRTSGIKLIHFSTDYVFGLDPTSKPLTEDDPPGPVGVYGLSKLAGEYLIRSISPDALVIRTCGLYGVWGSGGKGGNFVETMLRLAEQGKPIPVVDDQRCTPSYTVDVAEATAALIRSGASGLFHVTNTGSCTWHEFAAEIFRQAKLTPQLKRITSEEFRRPAHRPSFSVLSTAKCTATVHSSPRPWPEALAAYLVERQTKTH
ncbi:MAG TPA: dTDP-4-dehydrorhamnose reductase [Gemmata sp.]|nr:dTDP-4-dehydrorhamnose reductase [Gemmata sp.]